ncbi:MAG: 1-deoxy-D-xylulose-5-phosphate synthase [Bacteroidia bacterium]|nr:1-deoxy-D-xylulose-5-phosphate synthase [Bacteroidia bacterium]
MGLLENIDDPGDLKKLHQEQLEEVCQELREFIIDTVSENGGHFAANLGVVELTVALHYVYDTPDDKIAWDVGHQAYAHKILTGRKKLFSGNRKLGGISGFPKISESIYDTFGTGHSSTSISAILGMASASVILKEKRQHIAVIGDGALSAGQAFEALNNAAISGTNITIIINDNNIGIDPNAGALNDYLLNLKQGENNWFKRLGFYYGGPIDGHNINALVEELEILKGKEGPKILHIRTVKGKGYAAAEQAQTKWHSTQAFDKLSGKNISSAVSKTQKFQDIFGKTILELAEKDKKIVAVTPAMLSGSSLHFMRDRFPDRVFDVGIAEQHAVTFSAGLATMALTPFCAIYSTFLQRGYDQLIHDVALQKLPVVFAIDRAGLVGDDGPTHHGAFDMAFLRLVPEMVIAAPSNEHELRNMMLTASKYKSGPFAIRYPRGNGFIEDWQNEMVTLEIGKGRTIRNGNNIAVLSIGTICNEVFKACDKASEKGIEVSHYDMRFVKPLDKKLLDEVFAKHEVIITVEDGCITGGFGSAVAEYAAEANYKGRLKMLGIPDKFIEHGTITELQALCGFDAEGIFREINLDRSFS